jgi:hypothetical protein
MTSSPSVPVKTFNGGGVSPGKGGGPSLGKGISSKLNWPVIRAKPREAMPAILIFLILE